MTTHYCHFKPDSVATYYCHNCHTYSCDEFSKETSRMESRCFLCDSDLESLGTGSSAEPFWRRLDQTFRYAFNIETLIFIVGTSILSTFLMIMPGIMAMVLQLIVTSAFIKYCFVCLQSTAYGNMKPPSMTESYNDGISSLLKLIFVFFVIFGMCAGAIFLFGKNIGALLSVMLISALPAAIIVLALDDSPFSAVNPIKLGAIIKSIGLGYGVLLAFILMMSSSVAILSSVFSGGFTVFTSILQSFISSFYTVVMFHMMGYMIFQYQSDLGFTARDDLSSRTIRSEAKLLKAQISALLREGRFEDVSKVYANAFKKNRNDLALARDYFKYLFAIQDESKLATFGDSYVKLLTENNRLDEARLVYKQLTHVVANFKPSSSYTRFALAQSFYEVNEGLLAVKIINGTHKDNPDFEKLPEAYAFCADILEKEQGKEHLAEKFRRFSETLIQKRTQPTQKQKIMPDNGLVTKSTISGNTTNRPQAEQTNREEGTGKAAVGGSSGLSLVPMDEQ